jgi:hypothetical protein
VRGNTNAPNALAGATGRDSGPTDTRIITPRELSDAAVTREAEQLAVYLTKPGTLGAAFWLSSKGFGSADRRAIMLTLAGLEDGAA